MEGQVQELRALGSRYVLERVLGTGAMGQVHLALDQRTGERVAAKLLRQEFTRDPEIVARFVQERSILLGLVHPNIVRVRDLVVEGDDLAMVMDLVEGADLRARLREAGTLPAHSAVEIVLDVLAALAEAHGSGVLHRDVKPDNVLIADGEPPRVLLSDFGISRLAQETTVRMTGMLGTAEYMAPEVFIAEQISPAADVYGTGVMLYELVSGRTPFAGAGTGYAVANRHVNALPPEVPGLPAALWEPLQTLLAKDPLHRPTAAAAAEALRAALPQLAGLPALPLLVEPTAWQPAGGRSLAGGAVSAPLDAGHTQIRSTPSPLADTPPVDAPEGGWPAAAPQLDESVLAGSTQLRAPAAPPRPAPVPEPEPAARRLSQDRRVWAASIAAVLVLAGIAFVVFPDGGSAPRESEQQPAVAAPATLDVAAPPVVAPSGLSTVREASYDAENEVLTTTVTWSAGTSALSGPFFEVVPGAPGQACPDVVWDLTALRDTTAGIDDDVCGWQVAAGTIPARGSVQAVYTVPLELGGDDPAAAVRERLRTQLQAGADALAALGATTVYPAQRLESLEVQVQGTVRVGGLVDLLVLPVWVGSTTPSNVDALYSSRSPKPTQLLRQLGGELVLSTADCSGAIAFTGGVPYANTSSRACTISARLGSLEATSRTFDVAQNSTG